MPRAFDDALCAAWLVFAAVQMVRLLAVCCGTQEGDGVVWLIVLFGWSVWWVVRLGRVR